MQSKSAEAKTLSPILLLLILISASVSSTFGSIVTREKPTKCRVLIFTFTTIYVLKHSKYSIRVDINVGENHCDESKVQHISYGQNDCNSFNNLRNLYIFSSLEENIKQYMRYVYKLSGTGRFSKMRSDETLNPYVEMPQKRLHSFFLWIAIYIWISKNNNFAFIMNKCAYIIFIVYVVICLCKY